MGYSVFMTYYTENTFDHTDAVTFVREATIGHRKARFSVQTKALSAYPDWHHVHMHADYVASVDVSTRDVLGCIADLQEAWIIELNEHLRKRGK